MIIEITLKDSSKVYVTNPAYWYKNKSYSEDKSKAYNAYALVNCSEILHSFIDHEYGSLIISLITKIEFKENDTKRK